MIAFDVGLGTQDILVGSNVNENSTKFVLPSPTQVLKNKIKELDQDLFLSGYAMGGGPLSREIISHSEEHRVVMTEDAARTISDDLNEVREENIELVEDSEGFDTSGFKEITLSDLLAFPKIKELLDEVGEEESELVGVGVQDHGVAPEGMSDRRYRFNFFKKAIKEGNGLRDLIHREETERFSRVNGCIRYINDIGYMPLVVDSKMAAVIGCLGENNRVVVDAGNGHFLAASCRGNELVGLFEHHSSQLNETKIMKFIRELIDGSLRNEEVFRDGGHGAFVEEALEIDEVVVTGPRRSMMPSDLSYRLAHPLGDVMMTGAFGLFRARDIF